MPRKPRQLQIPIFSPRGHEGAAPSSVPLQAGIPAADGEKFEFSLDLNSYVAAHPESTFFVKVQGDSMEGAGIFSGDLLVIDRSLSPVPGKVVLAVIDGDFTVKRVVKEKGKTYLASEPLPGKEKAARVELSGDSECFVWGVVAASVHKP